MGDVALVTPVIDGLLRQYPDFKIFVVTRPAFTPFFKESENLKLFLTDFKGIHKGFGGILRLYRDLAKQAKFDYVIDLHSVLRSWVLGFLFRLSGVPVAGIKKGRMAKRRNIRGGKKTELKHSVQRYCDVLTRAGLPVTLSDGPWIVPPAEAAEAAGRLMDLSGSVINIGVAPFAKHQLKMWPAENMIHLMEMIAENRKVRFWLFGGRDESDRLKEIERAVPSSQCLPGYYSLSEELALMGRLDFMIAMDSSNMHMASLAGTKVVSVWGGTDPVNGFSAWQQPPGYTVRISFEELPCRPCTIFGKGKCRRGDLACLAWLTPGKVYRQITDTGLVD